MRGVLSASFLFVFLGFVFFSENNSDIPVFISHFTYSEVSGVSFLYLSGAISPARQPDVRRGRPRIRHKPDIDFREACWGPT